MPTAKERMRLAERAIDSYVVEQPDVPRPPGPRPLDLLRNNLLQGIPREYMIERICRQWPGVAHVAVRGEHLYFASDPSLIVDVFVTHGRQTVKPLILQSAKSILGEGLLTAEGEHHLRQRRLIQPAFHRSRIAGYATSMVDEGENLSGTWHNGQFVDMAAEMSRVTLQIVGRTLFGADLSGDAREVADALGDVLDNSTAVLTPFSRIRSRLRMPPFHRTVVASDRLDRIVQKMIEEHRAAGDTGDLLSMMIAAQEDGVGMTDAQLRDESMTLVLAGHETTAMWMTWTWLLLARNPDQAAWLHEELDARPDGSPTFADMAELPRTRAVLAESLRLYPPAWSIGRKVLADIHYDGWTIPAGSSVIAPQWVMHRDPRYWETPAAFRPRRWINAAGEYDEKQPGVPKGVWYPFGFGRRQCIGDQFAWTEATLLLALLAREWDPRIEDPRREIVPEGNITLRPRGGLPMVLIRRPDPAA
jgi:cytochrome P450